MARAREKEKEREREKETGMARARETAATRKTHTGTKDDMSVGPPGEDG